MEVDDFLAHYGVKGMRWGVQRNNGPRLTRRERLEKAYATKYGEAVAKTKVDSRIRTEKIIAISGAVLLTTAVAVVAGRELHKEFAPINLAKGTSFQNINQHGVDFDLDRITFATFKPRDNAIYRDRFSKELLMNLGRKSNEVYATELKAVKDLKIPSKATAKRLFKEFEAANGIVPKTSAIIRKQGGGTKKIRLDVTTRMINNNRTRQIGDPKKSAFLAYVSSQGYDAIQDVMDQRKGSYNAKTPLMFVNGAQAMVVKGAEALDSMAIFEDIRAGKW